MDMWFGFWGERNYEIDFELKMMSLNLKNIWVDFHPIAHLYSMKLSI
ncbi:hypothetical protein LEP1GSC072_2987 [Leptospira noguchii str. Bonito]|nr:hypothetical protein LEP1GSC072_2987 [Leptospira noguchii str. Bonito]